MLVRLLEAGVKPWVLEQALAAEAAAFEEVVRAVDPIRELER